MTTHFASVELYKEPGTPARLFVYGFAAASPVLTLGLLFVPAAIVERLEGASEIAYAIAASVAWGLLLALGVRMARRLASKFTPPLPLPGDIWRIGTPPPPKRSSNWPLRLFRRRPDGGVPVRRAA
ncbi:MAG: hypothetical protein ACRDKS_16510 [Actinomycetota bacterium]